MSRAAARRVSLVCNTCPPNWVPTRTSRQLLYSNGSRRKIRDPAATRWSSTTAQTPEKLRTAAVKRTVVPPPPPPGIAELAAAAEASQKRLLSMDGIPPLQQTTDALRFCRDAAITLHANLKRAEAQSRASASRLALLGAERTGSKLPIDAKLQEAANKVSHAAYAIITNPNIEMRTDFLDLYVQIQHHLGRPESLPSVLQLYATKPKPTMKDGKIHYVRPYPNLPYKAVEVEVADLALRTAIEAKHLDSALGIIEASYSTKAFKRQKLFKYATPPAIAVATLPFSIFGVSTAYALYCQNTMDVATATALCCTGISGYFLAVGSLGLIAKFSYKDHMRRVTWAPGTPLRHRWMREEERAAFDAVACAWGYKEEFRHGEETGADWEGLKEYLGYRSMILDRVEFMKGMN
ncbi:hypothetical protein XA68_12583 [Ophiocordyceps unilateralis]|uniref:Uncharacterized protein n=1 Tax=Ophiocordyceps unilateralis TaxID=268505 RepID=A0A2A9PE55_OPHUN|nr:hypothetical protein XA68_12583 [Ophiocordyceps unilateralis]